MAEGPTAPAAASGTTVQLLVRLYAGARAAAGTRQTQVTLSAGAQVGDALTALTAAHPGVAKVLPACSLLLDEVRAAPGDPVGDARTLDVLPPFSGG